MRFESKKIIENLEKQIEQSYALPIFKGYIAVNKRGVEKFIDTIYTTLPADVKNAREFLTNSGLTPTEDKNNPDCKSNIYTHLVELENEVDKSFPFMSYIIVNVQKIEKILDKIYNNLPQEIIQAEELNKQ